MHMVRGADRDRINVLVHLLQHPAKVPVDLHLVVLFREIFNEAVAAVGVDITKGHNLRTVLVGTHDIAGTLASNPDAGHVDPVIGTKDMAWQIIAGQCRGGSRLDKGSPGGVDFPELHDFESLFRVGVLYAGL